MYASVSPSEHRSSSVWYVIFFSKYFFVLHRKGYIAIEKTDKEGKERDIKIEIEKE